MVQICRCIAGPDIHHTSDRQERMVSLPRVCQYRHAGAAQSELKLLQCSSVGWKMQHGQHPVKNISIKISMELHHKG